MVNDRLTIFPIRRGIAKDTRAAVEQIVEVK